MSRSHVRRDVVNLEGRQEPMTDARPARRAQPGLGGANRPAAKDTSNAG